MKSVSYSILTIVRFSTIFYRSYTSTDNAGPLDYDDAILWKSLFQQLTQAIANNNKNIPIPVRTFVFNVDGSGEYNKCLTTAYFTYGRWIGFKLSYYFAEKVLWINDNKYYFK